MKRIQFRGWIFSLVLLLSCEKKESDTGVTPQTQADVPLPASSELIEATAILQSISYDKSSHTISLKISYGGCSATKHQLILNDICAESYPRQCSATLKRPKSFDPTCKMALQEDVILKLEDDFDTAYVRVTSSGKTSEVLVDRKGQITPNTP